MKLLSIKVEIIADDDPDASYLEQDAFKDRLEQYKNGVFYFVGVRTTAEIVDSNSVIQYVSGGSLWNIESDDESGIETYKSELLLDLEKTLIDDYGFTREQIDEVGYEVVDA